jgi:NAD(P)-dependent dehydrogenase (short-subunit alcohol dehydrogenase family)
MKTILVTGANRGLGLGFTRHYLDCGYRVFACARNWEQCEQTARLRELYGERFRPLNLDVTDEQAISTLPDSLDDFDLDIVINNAGTLSDEPFGRWSTSTFEAAMAINCVGPALVAQALSAVMKRNSQLINISSGLASNGLNINPETGLDAYAASKAALNMVTRRLSAKLEAREITVVAIDPGWVKTRMGGEEAELTIDESIADVTQTIKRLSPGQSGLFLSRKGEALPW